MDRVPPARQFADAVLFVTPEYNRSVPAALKNGLDVGSRPYGSSVWDRKPGAIASCSPSAIGAFGANHHLRQSLVFLNVPTMHSPKLMSAMPTSSSMNMASSSTTAPANSCRSSCRHSRTGSRRLDPKAGACGVLRHRGRRRDPAAKGGCDADAQESSCCRYRWQRCRPNAGEAMSRFGPTDVKIAGRATARIHLGKSR